MIADRRRLELIFLFAGFVVTSKPVRLFAEGVDAVILRRPPNACALGYQAVGDVPRPPPLARAVPDEYDDMGNLTAVAEAAKVTDLKRLKPATLAIDIADPANARALANLDDGIYVYGIDNANHLVMMPRNLIPGSEILANPNAPSLGSHAGLMLVLKDKFGARSQFVSTGEFVRRNGRVFAVDNKSGTYPGGSESLKYGVQKLKAAGLEVNERTKIADASKFETSAAHDAAYKQVRTEAKVMADPVRRKLFDEAKRVMKKADGKFDDVSLARFLPASLERDARIAAGYFYERWRLPSEGTAYIFDDVYSTRFAENPEAFRRMLEEVEKAAEVKK